MVHHYGPHYFRTNHDSVIQYLSRFTEWIDGNYIVKSKVGDKTYPFPINLETLEQFFGIKDLSVDQAEQLLEEKRIDIRDPQNSEEFVLSRLGPELYNAFYLGYTLKQWGKHPKELDASVCGRIPIKLNRDPYYVEHKFRKFPSEGFTSMFSRMINHPLINVKLNTDYFALKDKIVPQKATIYTGPIDRFYNFEFGKLEWRSLDFVFEALETEFAQECVQINYPGDTQFTRKVEIKHVTGQEHSETVVCTEYPKAEGEPYYPVPNKENHRRYLQYKAKADTENKVYFVGRLAEYTYINSDEAILKGLQLFDELSERHF